MRRETTVTQGQIDAAWALLQKAKLPEGFTLERAPAKPGRLGIIVRGPKTNGHPTGEAAWDRDLQRQQVDNAVLVGLSKSCKAWAAEERVGDAKGEA